MLNQINTGVRPRMPKFENLIEWAGSGLGLIGALLLALNLPISGYGFVAFLASNCCWIAWGVRKRAFGLLTMQAGFTITSVLGIVRWIS